MALKSVRNNQFKLFISPTTKIKLTYIIYVFIYTSVCARALYHKCRETIIYVLLFGIRGVVRGCVRVRKSCFIVYRLRRLP